MNELYLATCDGKLHISVPDSWPEDIAPFIESIRNESFLNFEPIWPVGDPELAFSATYLFPDSACGFVVVFIKDTPQYALLAQNRLALTAASSYAAQIVSNLRYGSDIYQETIED